jgi:DNA-binding IclR family transcriptional regulator
VGKALLASLHHSEVKRIIADKGLKRYTRHTITDPRELEAELDKVRALGYAVDNEEIMDSLRCIAAPVKDNNGKTCAAISVSGPVSRLDGENFRRALETITQTALEISVSLGYSSVVGSEASGA